MNQPRQSGPQAGFSLIELLIVVTVIGLLSAIAILYLNQAKQAARSASAVNSLRLITTGENSYRAARGQFADLPTLSAAGYISDDALAAGEKSSYSFAVTLGADPTLNYTATATPVTAPTVNRHFFVNESGVMRAEVGAAATAVSQAID
ncbi:MAG TPA: prepilin-type N-terminal cleavage/methylation domain-containing protein [Pyrinomonadaceae bacterium]|nr:prepilin-type N-terminal cleavage/methylation domain-containing protein [Pyrinomonadaceae bacterium]